MKKGENVSDKEKAKIVVPGELLTEERKKIGSNVFHSNGKLYSTVTGFVKDSGDMVSVVALKGFYMPQVNDTVIGIVKKEEFSGYVVDINSFYYSFIPKRNLDDQTTFKLHDIITAKVEYVNEVNDVDLVDIRRLFGGDLINVSPVKVPRIIGAKASMLQILKEKTGVLLFVGRNGRVWLKGDNSELCLKAIREIEKHSFESNLTVKIEKMLDDELKKPVKKEGKVKK